MKRKALSVTQLLWPQIWKAFQPAQESIYHLIITEKLYQESTDLESVWSNIYEIYDAELVTTNYLDYALMVRESGET